MNEITLLHASEARRLSEKKDTLEAIISKINLCIQTGTCYAYVNMTTEDAARFLEKGYQVREVKTLAGTSHCIEW